MAYSFLNACCTHRKRDASRNTVRETEFMRPAANTPGKIMKIHEMTSEMEADPVLEKKKTIMQI